jgi:hypothetical protein
MALFDRAAARDFADVYVLARRFGKDTLLTRATQIDAGLDRAVLALMLATLDRLSDTEIPCPTAPHQPSSGPSTPTGSPSCRHKPRLPVCGSTPGIPRTADAMRGRFAAGVGDGLAVSLAGVPLLVAGALKREEWG